MMNEIEKMKQAAEVAAKNHQLSVNFEISASLDQIKATFSNGKIEHCAAVASRVELYRALDPVGLFKTRINHAVEILS